MEGVGEHHSYDPTALTGLSSPFLPFLQGAPQALLTGFRAPPPYSHKGSALTSIPSPLGPPFPGDQSFCWTQQGTAQVLGDAVPFQQNPSYGGLFSRMRAEGAENCLLSR